MTNRPGKADEAEQYNLDCYEGDANLSQHGISRQ
jgi:hypothetical protein